MIGILLGAIVGSTLTLIAVGVCGIARKSDEYSELERRLAQYENRDKPSLYIVGDRKDHSANGQRGRQYSSGEKRG